MSFFLNFTNHVENDGKIITRFDLFKIYLRFDTRNEFAS